MNGNIAAFTDAAERDKLHAQISGDAISWSELNN
jgi:hypothetical protein